VIVGLRHATVENPEWVVYARLPDFHLSLEGRREAAALAASLAQRNVAGIYASPLERAVETAQILAAPHHLPVATDERLTEWGFWVHWQGMPWPRVRERDPDLLERYARDPAAVSPGDPLMEAGRRILQWAEDADRHHPGGLVLGVTHEAPLVAALLMGGDKDLSAFHSTNVPHLGAVRLRPGTPESVDLVQWARVC
jgi:broad specificity phosphatase PhoE